jgi:hypothetical protein
MSFCLITPTRGDRPLFKEQYWNIIKSQTVQPDEVIVMDYKPESDKKDLTQRYRRGIEKATANGHEFALLWEDDDWYHPEYIQWYTNKWNENNKPDVLGIDTTYYYHIGIGGYMKMHHPERSSAFCMLIKLPYTGYPPDEDPFFDSFVFRLKRRRLNKKRIQTIPLEEIYAIGIKHNHGMSGGSMHEKVRNYNSDSESFKRHCLDYEIYNEIAIKIKEQEKLGAIPNVPVTQGRS